MKTHSVLIKTKKVGIFMLMLLLTFALAACSSDDKKIESTTFEPTEIEGEVEEEAEKSTEAYEPYYVEDYALNKLDGTETSLKAYDNDIIVLNFWATWCQYCIKEMPLLDEMDLRDDITVLAVSVGEDKKLVEDYITENGYKFEVFLDEESTLASTFGVTGFPTTVFLGRDLELYYVYPGMLDQTTFDAILEAIGDINAKKTK